MYQVCELVADRADLCLRLTYHYHIKDHAHLVYLIYSIVYNYDKFCISKNLLAKCEAFSNYCGNYGLTRLQPNISTTIKDRLPIRYTKLTIWAEGSYLYTSIKIAS